MQKNFDMTSTRVLAEANKAIVVAMACLLEPDKREELANRLDLQVAMCLSPDALSREACGHVEQVINLLRAINSSARALPIDGAQHSPPAWSI